MAKCLNKYKSDLLIAFIFIFTAAVTFSYTGCNDDINVPDTPIFNLSASLQLLKSSNEEKQQINDAIEDFALIVARSLNDRTFREFYKAEAMKKFDGDFDILYSLVKDNLVGGKSLHTRLSEIAEDIKKSTEIEFKTKFNTLDELVAKIDEFTKVPKLNIAIYVKCEEWNTNSFIPPVACLNSEIKNEAVKHIKAYESNGSFVMQGKAVTPNHTVLAITLNERLDEDGNVRECYSRKTEMLAKTGGKGSNILSDPIFDIEDPGNPPGGGGVTPKRDLIFKKLHRINDDVWNNGGLSLEGDPEFYFEVYMLSNNQTLYVGRKEFDCSYIELIKFYSMSLRTTSNTELIYLALKEEDGGLLGSDDQVENDGWLIDWDLPAGVTAYEYNNSYYPYNKPDDPYFSIWYEGNSGNVNMFAEWGPWY
jgi:hypothetical protein